MKKNRIASCKRKTKNELSGPNGLNPVLHRAQAV